MQLLKELSGVLGAMDAPWAWDRVVSLEWSLLELIYGMVSWWLWLSQVDSELLGSPFPKRMADTNDGGISLAELVMVAGVVLRAARLCGVGLMRMAEFFVQLRAGGLSPVHRPLCERTVDTGLLPVPLEPYFCGPTSSTSVWE